MMRPEMHARADHADAGGGDEQLVARPLGHDLGVAGDDFDAGFSGGFRH